MDDIPLLLPSELDDLEEWAFGASVNFGIALQNCREAGLSSG